MEEIWEALEKRGAEEYGGEKVTQLQHGLQCAMLAEQDKEYFRETRSRRFGMPLEQFAADADDALPAFHKALNPMRTLLTTQDYLGGAGSSFADYIVFGAFQWARVSSARDLLTADDPIAMWRGRLLDRFDGLAAQTPARAA